MISCLFVGIQRKAVLVLKRSVSLKSARTEHANKKVVLGEHSPYKDMFGVENLGRGRPNIVGVHEDRRLPFVAGLQVPEKKKAVARALVVLKYEMWNRFAELFQAEAAYLIAEKKEKEDG